MYAISSYGFIKWDGPPPQLVQQHLAKFTKAGQNGISAQLLGVHGDSFEVTLTAAVEIQDQGMVFENAYRTLVGSSPQPVMFNGVNYQAAYGHLYLVERVQIESFTRHPLLVAPGYVYYGGWLLKSRWTLTPIAN